MLEKWHRTLMFPISWSNRPPSAPATRMHSWQYIKNKLKLKCQTKYVCQGLFQHKQSFSQNYFVQTIPNQNVPEEVQAVP